MKIDVLNTNGSSTGRSVDLPDDIFGIEPNEHILYLSVKGYLASQRQGTHKAKERGEVKGSTKKIKKQKGTGTARFGDIKNPIFRGGGRIFGPRPRKYGIKLNKKVKAIAKKSAFSVKLKADQIKVLEDFTLETPKTKEFNNILNNVDAAGMKTLLVTSEHDNNLYLSSRNLYGAQVRNVVDLNVYDMLNANCVILSEGSIEKLIESLA